LMATGAIGVHGEVVQSHVPAERKVKVDHAVIQHQPMVEQAVVVLQHQSKDVHSVLVLVCRNVLQLITTYLFNGIQMR